MKLYSKEIKVAATAYIRAENKEVAEKIAQSLRGKVISEEVVISDLAYDDPNLPKLSVSPAMTIVGVEPGVVDDVLGED